MSYEWRPPTREEQTQQLVLDLQAWQQVRRSIAYIEGKRAELVVSGEHPARLRLYEAELERLEGRRVGLSELIHATAAELWPDYWKE